MISVQYGALALLAAATYSVAQGVVNMHFSIPIALNVCFIFSGLGFLEFIPFLWVYSFYCCLFFFGSLSNRIQVNKLVFSLLRDNSLCRLKVALMTTTLIL